MVDRPVAALLGRVSKPERPARRLWRRAEPQRRTKRTARYRVSSDRAPARNLLALALSVLVALAVLASPVSPVGAASAAGNTILVDDDGAECPGSDFGGIQKAVDSAASGDTVEVCSGTYGGVIVDVPVDLVGNGTVTIAGSGTVLETTADSVLVEGVTVNSDGTGEAVYVRGNDTVLRDLRVDDFKYGVTLDPVTNTTIENVNASHGGNIGLQSLAADNTTVRDGTFNSTDGIALFAGSGGSDKSRNVTFTNVMVANSGDDAFRLYNAAGRVVIENSTAHSSAGRGIDVSANADITGGYVANTSVTGSGGYGIYLDDVDGYEIRNTTVANNGDSGLRLSQSASLTVRNVTVRSNTGQGIWLADDSDNARILDSDLSGTANDGIYIANAASDGTDGTTVRDNNLTGRNIGVYVGNSADNTSIAANNISATTSQAVLVYDANNTVVTDNVMRNAGSNAMSVLDDTGTAWLPRNTTVRRNVIVGGSKKGLFLHSPDSTVADNSFRDNADDGIYVDGVDGVSVRNNTIDSSGGYGISLASANRTTVRNNTVSGTSYSTVYVSNGGNNTLLDNELSKSGGSNSAGIYLYSSNVNTVRSNNASRNGYVGLWIDESDGTVVRNNTFAKNGYYGISFLADSSSDRSRDTLVVNNTIRNNQQKGVIFYYGANNTLERNTISSNNNVGIDVRRVGDGIELRNNTVANHTTGVAVDGTDHLTISDNRIRNNTNGTVLTGRTAPVNVTANVIVHSAHSGVVLEASAWASTVSIHRNILAGNDRYGVYSANESAIVDARNNYWGAVAPSSPGGTALEDPATGTLADGSGDAVSANASNPGVSNVRFDPALNLYSNLALSETTISTGDSVTVSASVTNPSGAAYTTTALLSINGTVDAQTTIDLAPDETTTVEFSRTFQDPGTYSVAIDGLDAVLLTVTEPAVGGTVGETFGVSETVVDVVRTDGGVVVVVKRIATGEPVAVSLPPVGTDGITLVALNMSFETASREENRVVVRPLRDRPAEVPQPDGSVLGYVRIDVDGPLAGRVAESQLTVRLDPSRLDELDASAGTVHAQRYDGGEWESLSTAAIDDRTIRFTTPGYSTFAIVADETRDTSSTPTSTTTATETATESPSTTTQTATETTRATSTPGGAGPGFTALTSALALILAALLVRRRI